MQFDFDTFSKAVKMVYREGAYTLDDVLSVFGEYFAAYEEFIGAVHPMLKVGQIKHIMAAMPYLTKDYQSAAPRDIEPDCYPDLIAQHFLTEYKGRDGNGCDYNINHFFSGSIRELRYYETLY